VRLRATSLIFLSVCSSGALDETQFGLFFSPQKNKIFRDRVVYVDMARPLLTFAALASLLAAASSASAGPSAMRILHVTLDPGNYIDAATTVDASGAPAFIFGTGNVPPVSAMSYDGSGNLRWSFFNKSAGKVIKTIETTAARHCESGGKGAGAVDVFVTEADVFNDVGFTVFGLSSAAESAAPV
jgi:hypothetical protein